MVRALCEKVEEWSRLEKKTSEREREREREKIIKNC
jgi:hypothetical protein